MKICRFGDARLGVVEGPNVRDVTAALDVLPAYRYPLPTHDVLIAHLDKVTERIRAISSSAPSLPLAGLKLLSPVANPGKVVAAPVNYQKHLTEARSDPQIHHGKQLATIQEAGLFLKATSSLVGPGEGIALHKLDRRNDHEVELAFVIGKKASNVSRKKHSSMSPVIALAWTLRFAGPK